MSNFNYELSLINSPYFDKLLSEMKMILEQKRKLLKGIRNTDDFNKSLSYSNKGIYGSILKRENEILRELIRIKGWTVIERGNLSNSPEKSDDFDVYDNNHINNFI